MKSPTAVKKGAKDTVYLIVNADDFCYSNGISRGILEAARNGIITATGVIATNSNFEKHINWLKEFEDIDIGVHLCLSFGRPLTSRISECLSSWDNKFPKNKYYMAWAILSKKISISDVTAEWEEQIVKLLDSGIKVQFLNSHEHLHIIPPLFKVAKKLSKKFKINFIRIPSAEWMNFTNATTFIRNAILQTLTYINKYNIDQMTPKLIGVSKSGKINTDYLRRRFSTLQKGQVYELMCHPGYFDPNEIKDSHLLSYHDWEGELSALSSAVMRDLYKINNIKIVRFRDLDTSNGVLKVNI